MKIVKQMRFSPRHGEIVPVTAENFGDIVRAVYRRQLAKASSSGWEYAEEEWEAHCMESSRKLYREYEGLLVGLSSAWPGKKPLIRGRLELNDEYYAAKKIASGEKNYRDYKRYDERELQKCVIWFKELEKWPRELEKLTEYAKKRRAIRSQVNFRPYAEKAEQINETVTDSQILIQGTQNADSIVKRILKAGYFNDDYGILREYLGTPPEEGEDKLAKKWKSIGDKYFIFQNAKQKSTAAQDGSALPITAVDANGDFHLCPRTAPARQAVAPPTIDPTAVPLSDFGTSPGRYPANEDHKKYDM
jgi:hypothetical protein